MGNEARRLCGLRKNHLLVVMYLEYAVVFTITSEI